MLEGSDVGGYQHSRVVMSGFLVAAGLTKLCAMVVQVLKPSGF